MRDAIVVSDVSKRFRYPWLPRHTTIKEAIVKGYFSGALRSKYVSAITNVSLRIERGQVLGIIGRNGSGKSTLMRVMAGIILPDWGTVTTNGDVAPLLSLGVGFHPDLTGRENAKIDGLVRQIHPAVIEERMASIEEFSEIGEFFDAPMRTYSTGMYARLAFAAAIGHDPDILLLDEVFAVGDGNFNKKCRDHMNALRDRGKTIVVASHDLAMIEDFCDVALWLEHGAVRAFGNPSLVTEDYALSL